MKRHSLLLLLICIFIFCACSLEEEYASVTMTGTVSGTNGTPLAEVAVEMTLLNEKLSATTNLEGIYTFHGVRPGFGKLSFKKTGYIPLKNNLIVYNGKLNKYDQVLESYAEKSYLRLLTGNVLLHNYEKSVVLRIETNAYYTVKYEGDWIEISGDSHFPGADIQITATENETTEERSAKVIITGEYGQVIETIIKQRSGPVFKPFSTEKLETQKIFY